MSTAQAPVAVDMEQLYQQRMARYTTAMRNEMPDRVPIRPFVAEFTGTYAGYTCQQLAHDYEQAFAAARKCAADFDWDAVVANMVYVWTGLAQALDLDYYAIPGIHIPADTGFQYREPPENDAYMQPEEYDALIEDPTGFLHNVWFPRVAKKIMPMGGEVNYDHNLALIKSSMAMMQYFSSFGVQNERLRTESGTVSAIAGILKAPLDIIADKLRGYLGLVEDLMERRDKVVAACEALAPHLCNVAVSTADPGGNVPVGLWMHRGCVPFVSFDIFDNIYWATLKPIIEEIWAAGHQTLFYAEGSWDHHLEAFRDLPDRSIVYHVDQGDVFKVHEALGDKFCLSGGVSNVTLAFGTPDDIRKRCKEIIERVAQDGGYIMDASAIVQNDAKIENIKAMTDATLEYGVYSRGHSNPLVAGAPKPTELEARPGEFLATPSAEKPQPGECVSWSKYRQELDDVPGDEALCKNIWQNVDGLANMYIWQMLLSF